MEVDSIDVEEDHKIIKMTKSIWEMTKSIWEMTVSIWDTLSLWSRGRWPRGLYPNAIELENP
jgi:hypothetical protein